MNRGEEVSGELVVPGCDPAEVLEAAEAALDNIAPLVGALVELVERNAVGFVRNDRRCAMDDDRGAQLVAIISLVADERGHGGRERQHAGRRGDIGVLVRRQMENHRPAMRIAQGMDFGRATASRPADRLIVLPPFPPEAQR